MSLRTGKRTIWVFDQVTRADRKLEIVHLRRRGIAISVLRKKKKGAVQLCSYYCTADLRLGFHICRLLVFWCGGSNVIIEIIDPVIIMSRIVRKRDYCLCENKGADQLRSNCEADQRLCFRYSDSTIPLLLKSEISSV